MGRRAAALNRGRPSRCVYRQVSGVVGQTITAKNGPRRVPWLRDGGTISRRWVFIHGADRNSAQMLTLAHELAHIWAGSLRCPMSGRIVLEQGEIGATESRAE